MSKIPGPIGLDPSPASPRTPGPLGYKDAADPSTPDSFVGDTPGPLGQNDYATPDYAQAPKFTWSDHVLYAGPVVAAPSKEVVLTSQEPGWQDWARQFAARRNIGGRKPVFFSKTRSTNAALEAYRKAAAMAGSGGTLIISAGHGYGDKVDKNANVTLAPGFVIQTGHFAAEILAKKRDKEILSLFKAIGKILQDRHVLKVLFVSCFVGEQQDFVQEIADGWKVTTVCYRKYISPAYWTSRGKRTYYIELKNDAATYPANKKEYLSWNYPIPVMENAWTTRPVGRKQGLAPEGGGSDVQMA